MYSSTVVVIKMLNDKGEATSLHGKMGVGVLLAQDIVVVIILAVLAAGRRLTSALERGERYWSINHTISIKIE